MAATIYYFTGTGNSLVVARMLAEKLEAGEPVSVVRAVREGLTVDSETAGVVFPMYYLGVPLIIKEFLETADFSSVKYLYVVDTKGVALTGGSVKIARRILRKRGIRLNAGFNIVMGENYALRFQPPDEKAQSKYLRRAGARTDKIAAVVKNRKKHFDRVIGDLIAGPYYNNEVDKISSYDKNFINTDDCNGCGICAKVCPADNILLNESGRPEWQNHCQMCLACLHFCPQTAIEYLDKTAGKKRYHHPGVKIKDIMGQKV